MQNQRYLKCHQDLFEVAVRISVQLIDLHIDSSADCMTADVTLARFHTRAFAEAIVDAAAIDSFDMQIVWKYIAMTHADFDDGETLTDVPKILQNFIESKLTDIVYSAIPIAWRMADGPAAVSRLKSERARREAEMEQRAADDGDWA